MLHTDAPVQAQHPHTAQQFSCACPKVPSLPACLEGIITGPGAQAKHSCLASKNTQLICTHCCFDAAHTSRTHALHEGLLHRSACMLLAGCTTQISAGAMMTRTQAPPPPPPDITSGWLTG